MADNTLLEKVLSLQDKYQSLQDQLASPDVMSDMKRYVQLNKDYKQLEPIIKAGHEYEKLLGDLQSAKDIFLNEKDDELREMAREEIADFAEWLRRNKYWREHIRIMRIVDNKHIYLSQQQGEPVILLGELSGYERKLRKLRTFMERGINALPDNSRLYFPKGTYLTLPLHLRSHITLDLAEEALRDQINPDAPREITLPYILELVSEQYGISTADIISKKKDAEIVLPRQIVMYLAKEMTQMPLKNIGQFLGGRDHSTVLHGKRKIEEQLQGDEALRNQLDILRKKMSP